MWASFIFKYTNFPTKALTVATVTKLYQKMCQVLPSFKMSHGPLPTAFAHMSATVYEKRHSSKDGRESWNCSLVVECVFPQLLALEKQ